MTCLSATHCLEIGLFCKRLSTQGPLHQSSIASPCTSMIHSKSRPTELSCTTTSDTGKSRSTSGARGVVRSRCERSLCFGCVEASSSTMLRHTDFETKTAKMATCIRLSRQPRSPKSHHSPVFLMRHTGASAGLNIGNVTATEKRPAGLVDDGHFVPSAR